MKQRTQRWLLVPLCAAFLMIGCGDDGGDGGGSGSSTGTATTDPTSDSTMDPGTTSMDPMVSTGAAESSSGADESSSGGAAACETDICATYGAAVPAVSEAVVMQAAADPLFMEDFAPLVAAGDDAVQAFIDSLAAFISDAYGCTDGAYTGPSMEDAHTGLDITQEEYDAFIALIAGVLADAGVPEADITACFAPPLVDPAFVATIVGL